MSDQDDDLFADSDESGDTDDLIAESKQKPIAKPKKKKILKKKKASSGGGNKRKRIPGKYFYSLFLSLSSSSLHGTHNPDYNCPKTNTKNLLTSLLS
jgi:hypothetical protein